ncbi:MAG TPA: pyruvate kinase [Acidimicrobiales bacterium]|nr:pyruvate kinase [Acidimicrobiales bacterium]
MAWQLPRRANIVCTLGPRSSSYSDVLALAAAGMDVARLNFSHGSHDDHAALIENVRAASDQVGRPIAVLQDLQGPKIRVGRFEGGRVELASGDGFVLTATPVLGDGCRASVSYSSFPSDVGEGDVVLLDDGRLKLEVRHIDGPDVHCKIIHGGLLSDHKGLNLPDAVLSVAAMTDKDAADLDFGMSMGVDYVAVSFVQTAADLIAVKAAIAARGKQVPLVAKIERRQAVADFDAISDHADAVMIARGDLGVEMLTEEVPAVQKDLIARCNTKGIPVITATQMLDSMVHSPRPTRAEASDVANAVLDGSDAVMLSAETATGAFPVEAVQTMDHIITVIEACSGPRWDLKRRKPDFVYPRALAVGYSACHAAELVGARAIVCLTQSGETAKMVARFRPRQPIIAVSSSVETYRRSSLVWGVNAVLSRPFERDIDDAVAEVVASLEQLGAVARGDSLVLTAGLPFSGRSETNMLRIEQL